MKLQKSLQLLGITYLLCRIRLDLKNNWKTRLRLRMTQFKLLTILRELKAFLCQKHGFEIKERV